MSDKAEDVFKRWIEYVNKLEAEKVVNLYDDKCIFLPTFSPHRMSNSQQINEYFRQLATRQNMRVELHPETLKKIEIDENKCILTGIYSFHFVVDDADLTFPSRFTFIIDISREKPIIHHHSSQIPRTLS